MQNFNSKEYWNNRFKTDHWELSSGRLQTSFFAICAINVLPDWFKEIVNTNRYSICDFGCAEGDAVPLLSLAFPSSTIVGVDYSEEAIERSCRYYPSYRFLCHDSVTLNERFDVMYTSNVLEHFMDPFTIAEQLIAQTNHFFIMLVPFNQGVGFGEHEFSFNHANIPSKIRNFTLCFKEVHYWSHPVWYGEQVLCIYKRDTDN